MILNNLKKQHIKATLEDDYPIYPILSLIIDKVRVVENALGTNIWENESELDEMVLDLFKGCLEDLKKSDDARRACGRIQVQMFIDEEDFIDFDISYLLS